MNAHVSEHGLSSLVIILPMVRIGLAIRVHDHLDFSVHGAGITGNYRSSHES